MPDSRDEPTLLYQNPDLAVFAKPPGMETISQDGVPDFQQCVRTARGEAGLTAVHRLDRDTSGAQLFARTPEAEKALVALFRQRQMRKSYLALCLGAPRNRTGSIQRRLSEWSGGRRPVRVLKQGGLEASTDYRVLARADAPVEAGCVSLVAFHPHQGRTHQIRVHAAALGYPIFGDDQYGDRAANRVAKQVWGLKRQALHSWRLAFPWRGGEVDAGCDLLPDMERAAASLWGEESRNFLTP